MRLDSNTHQIKILSLLSFLWLLTGRLHGFPLTFTHRLGGKWSSWGQLVSDRQNRNWTWTEKSHLVPEMSLWAQKQIYHHTSAERMYIYQLFSILHWQSGVHLTSSCWSAGLAVALMRRRNTSPEIAGCCLMLQRGTERRGDIYININYKHPVKFLTVTKCRPIKRNVNQTEWDLEDRAFAKTKHGRILF